MKKIILQVVLLCFVVHATAQKEIILKKGVVIDSVKLNDSSLESYSLYLPRKYKATEKWPIVFVVDLKGKGSNAISYFRRAAEEQGYIVAASNNTNDTLSTSQNILAFSKMYNTVIAAFSIDENRMYTSGLANGARLASALPVFIKKIKGVISCGAGINNSEFISNQQKPYYFIGIVGKEDYNYTEMIKLRKVLNFRKIPNELLVFDGAAVWPPQKYIREALQLLRISAMFKGYEEKNSDYIKQSYTREVEKLEELKATKKLLNYNSELDKTISIYNSHFNIDSLIEKRKELKKNKLFKELKRNQKAIFFNEGLIKEEYSYALEEDVATYNFNNLGWWNYQMGKINERIKSKNKPTAQQGKRLLGYVNALTNETIGILNAEKTLDEEALSFLWMLKTIVAPKEYSNYIKIIANSAKNEDFDTALFYLEELLKNGYTDKQSLYVIEHTGLLKITSEYNAIVAKYLKEARYELIEE